jgi:hypothetical protein
VFFHGIWSLQESFQGANKQTPHDNEDYFAKNIKIIVCNTVSAKLCLIGCMHEFWRLMLWLLF